MGKEPRDGLRPGEVVMAIEHLGVAWPDRYSFLHSFLRHVAKIGFTCRRVEMALDENGRGRIVYRATVGNEVLTFAAFCDLLPEAEQQDRIIATRWDAWAALFLGEPAPEDLETSRIQIQRVIWGRATPGTIVWSRANRSVRLFDHIVERLAQNRQPDPDRVNEVGYLVRTTGFSGNGRNGMLDYAYLQSIGHPLRSPYHAQMLASLLWREFGNDLAEHMARVRNPQASPLSPDIRRFMGIGNSSGIGLVPFTVRHPKLLERWIAVRERALRDLHDAVYGPDDARYATFLEQLAKARAYFTREPSDETGMFLTSDALVAALDTAAARYRALLADWSATRAQGATNPTSALLTGMGRDHPVEVHDLLAALAFELDDNAPSPEEFIADETLRCPPDLACGDLLGLIRSRFKWMIEDKAERPYFWYSSEENMEPRRGFRGSDDGQEFELPVDIFGRLQGLVDRLAAVPPSMPVGEFLFRFPDMRYMAQWAYTLADLDYAVARMDVLARDYAPLRIMRLQLATYGMLKFIPRSGTQLRATLLQGAGLPEELAAGHPGDGLFPVFPVIPSQCDDQSSGSIE